MTAFWEHASTGKCYQIGKGLLTKVLQNDKGDGDVISAGDGNYWTCQDIDRVTADAKREDKILASDAFKTISVSVREGNGWVTTEAGDIPVLELRDMNRIPMCFMGILPMRDPPRGDTAATVAAIRRAHVDVKMITGDHHDIAVKTSEQIDLGSEIHSREKLYKDWNETTKEGKVLDDDLILKADGFAQVVPTDKFNVIKSLQGQGIVCGMTGDGVNDAAALSAANCGIAVKGAVDAARAASDILLTEGGLSPIYSAIYESRCIFQRLRSYVIYRIGHSIHVVATLSVLILGFDYVLDPLYVILMALFNDLAITMIGYDTAIPTVGPSVPRTETMLVLAFVAGITQSASSILMFRFGDKFLQKDTGAIEDIAPEDIGRYHFQNKDGHGDDYIGTILYLQMATTAGLLMFSTRTRRFVLSGNPPDWRLVVSIVMAFILTLFMTGFKTIHQKIGWEDVGIVWLYNLGVALVVEVGKMFVILLLPEDRSEDSGISDFFCPGANQGLVQQMIVNDDEEGGDGAPLINEQAGGQKVLQKPPGSGVSGGSGMKRKVSLRASLTGDHREVPKGNDDINPKAAVHSQYHDQAKTRRES